MNEGKPRLLILGPGRHGKDTVAEILRDEHGFSFISSSYYLAEKVVQPELDRRGITYPDLKACYDDRGNHRELWRDIIAEFNAEDPARLAKMILAECDCYVGMRTPREYFGSRHLFDAVVWVDAASRVDAVDPTMQIEFDPATMHLIDNNGDLDDLYPQVADLVRKIDFSDQRNLL